MHAMEIVREVAQKTNTPLMHISKSLGKSRNYVNAVMTNKNTPKADNLAKMLDICGYKLCAVPKDQVTDEFFVID